MRKDLFLIFLIVFIGLLGFGIVIPTLPFVAKNFGASPTMIGLLFASYSFFQFLASPVLGRLSDRFGRKPILAISLLGTSVGFFMIAYAKSLFVIFLSRVVDGITGGNISVAQAYIADISEGKERTKAMGLIGAAFGLGFIFGPPVGGLLSTHLSLAAPYLFAAVLALVNSILIMLILPEPERKISTKNNGLFLNKEMLKDIFHPKIVLHITLIFVIVTLAFAALQGTFAIYTEKILSWDEEKNGWYFALVGLVSVFTQGFLIRKLLESFEEKRLLQAGVFLVGSAFFLIAAFKAAFYLMAAGVVLALGFGLLNTSSQSLISLYSKEKEQGVVLGTVQGFGSLARTIGPVVGGVLMTRVSLNSPYVFSTGIMVLAFFISIYAFKTVNGR